MSAFKGTPGPWVVGEDGDVIWAERWKGTIPHVATVPFSKDPRVAADARLIAAAPTMHEYIAQRAEAGDNEAKKILESINAGR